MIKIVITTTIIQNYFINMIIIKLCTKYVKKKWANYMIMLLVASRPCSYGSSPIHNWIVDSEALHHVTIDFLNLNLYEDYANPNDIIIRNDLGFKIAHFFP